MEYSYNTAGVVCTDSNIELKKICVPVAGLWWFPVQKQQEPIRTTKQFVTEIHLFQLWKDHYNLHQVIQT
jgi:hypothetical protein